MIIVSFFNVRKITHAFINPQKVQVKEANRKSTTAREDRKGGREGERVYYSAYV